MFITLEGIDGSGKSSQAKMLVKLLCEAGKKTLWTHEPGDWEQGKVVRSILLNGELKHPFTEVLLFLADRCEHVKQVIVPALREKQYVVCDRYNDSTLAYQCWGHGVDRLKVESLIHWCELPVPDITFWLDLPVETAIKRRVGRGGQDRIEGEDISFHENVAEGFRALAKENPSRICRIDALESPSGVKEQILSELKKRGIL